AQEQLKEARRIQKEEKRRAEEERRLAAERAARKAALRRSAASFTQAAAKHAGALTNALAAMSARLKQALKACGDRLQMAAAFFRSLAGRIGRRVALFAGKPFSAPLFIAAALFCYVGIAWLYGYRIGKLEANVFTFQFYLCDFSVGICSRLFVGAVIALFTDSVPLSLINQIVNWAVSLAIIGQAVLAGLLLRAGLKNRSVPAALLGLLFMTNPLMVLDKLYLTGMLDIYLVLLLLLWLAFLKTPLLPLVTPVFCVVGMAIHYQFLFSHLPPMLTLLFFYAIFAQDKRKRAINASALVTGSVASAASFVYFVFFATENLKMTSDEFYLHMATRFGVIAPNQKVDLTKTLIPIDRVSLDYYLFGIDHGEHFSRDFGTYFGHLMQLVKERSNVSMLRKDILMFVPVFLLAAAIWLWCAKREKGFRKLPYLCFVAQALVLLPELLISTDVWRWFSAAMIAQFVVFGVVYLDQTTALHPLIDQLIFPKRDIHHGRKNKETN
ncbi:MAG: hypothetical protein IJK98_07025, partial [Clostridia bacterium]|nr:hypothetical protein [Clostridia bacterium]